MLHAKIRTTPGELCSFELSYIVYRDSSGNAKSIYDALQELDRYLLGYVHRWQGFHPHGARVAPMNRYLNHPGALWIGCP
jgi:hypothetical protein